MNKPIPFEQPREFLRMLFDAAVSRALPGSNLASSLPAPPRGRTVVIGAGKASAAMAEAVDAHWPADSSLSGLVITRYGHIPPSYEASRRRIEVVMAGHPVPDSAGRDATQRILQQLKDLTADDLVLCLISGGGSALLSEPAAPVTVDEKRAVTEQLLRCGAAIDEMNCVRKHLSAVKGGRLAAACGPAQVVTLVISDVPGDDPSMIASGPTVGDATTCSDALAVIDRYDIAISSATRQALTDGTLETPKPDDPCFSGHRVRVIATPRQSLEAAAEIARASGISVHILSDDIEGESRDVAKVHAALARSVARHSTPFSFPCVLLSGGETTVTVKAKGGKGGRASEFLLSCAITLQGAPGIWGLAGDTDGIDGVEDNAGSVIDPRTLERAAERQLNAQSFLDRNDAYTFFAELGDLVVTGPTFTNVNDFRALLILSADRQKD